MNNGVVFCNGRFISSRIVKRRFGANRQKSFSVSNPLPTRQQLLLLLLNSNDGSTNLKNRISKNSIKFRIGLLQKSSFDVIKLTAEQKKGRLPFTLIQSTAAAGLLLYAAVTQSPVSGTLLVALSVCISLTGYLHVLLHQTLPSNSSTPLKLYNAGYQFSKTEYSFRVDQSWTDQIGVMLNSSFYEPSPLYLALNCWGMYAIGQRLITVQFGGLGLVTLCFAAVLLGRFIQYLISKDTTPAKTSLDQLGLIELVCLPSGTWGFGPVLNCMIWFCCFSFPRVLYLATPTGVMAPVWTALAVPIVLLVEDVWSLVRPMRRQEKIDDGCAPGLQLGAILVAWIASIVMK